LLGLWRELHRRDPVQLQLEFNHAANKGTSIESVETAVGVTMPMFSWAEEKLTEVVPSGQFVLL
jgi:hypothetical protein